MATSCTVNINLKDLGFSNYASQDIEFTLLQTGAESATDTVIVGGTREVVTTDANGDASITLWVNGDSDVQSIYQVKLPKGERIKFIIPTGTSTIELAQLIAANQPTSVLQQSLATDRTTHTGGPDDLDGNEIILDVDGDTSITADTDDRIDFKIGGVDELTLTAAKADNLDDIAALTPTDGNVIVGNGTDWVAESGATARTSLGLGTGDTPEFNGADLDGGELVLDADADTSITADTDDQIDFKIGGVDELTLTAAKADNLDDIAALTPTDGNIIVGNGTDWVAESGATARTSLGLTIGTDVQAYDAGLNDIAGLSVTDGNIIVGDGANWVAESGATARTSLGLGTGDNVTFDTVDATTDVTTPIVQAASSAGGALKSNNGTTCLTWGSGGGANLTTADGLSVSGNISVTGSATTAGSRTIGTTVVNAATYDLLTTDHVLLVTYTSTGAVTSLTLPSAQTTDGRVIVVKDAGGSAGTNNITIDTEASETIDGSATLVISTNYDKVTLISDGTNWFTI